MQVCENTLGSYNCNCKKGYEAYSYTHGGKTITNCKEIKECTQRNSDDRNQGVCGYVWGSTCKDGNGSYTCECKQGYDENNEFNNCQDIDECQRETDTCEPDNSQCVNSIGKYKCECLKGYEKVGAAKMDRTASCTDIDECSEENYRLNKCDTEIGICENLLGSYACSCPNEGVAFESKFKGEFGMFVTIGDLSKRSRERALG